MTCEGANKKNSAHNLKLKHHLKKYAPGMFCELNLAIYIIVKHFMSDEDSLIGLDA